MAQTFTLEEANRALEELRPLIEQILAVRRSLINERGEVRSVIEHAGGNGGSRAGSRAVVAFDEIQEIIQTIQERGVIVRDVNAGLLDFPSIRDGRLVYLCWRYDEEAIRFWHEVDTGFGGRQPL